MVKPAAFPRLFLDFSFRSFVTPKLVQIIYFLAVVVSAIFALLTFIACCSLPSLLAGIRPGYGYGGGSGASGGGFVLGLIASPIEFVVNIILARVALEVTIVLFRIAENTDALRQMTSNAR